MNADDTVLCPGCDTQNISRNQSCPYCGWQLDDTRLRISSRNIVSCAPKKILPAELAITVDGTDSSKRFSTGIPLTLATIFQKLEAKAKIKVYLQKHGDLDFNEPHILLTNGGTPAQAQLDLKSITFHGGEDCAETHLDAIENLLQTIPFTLDITRARCAILAIMNGETKPLRSGMSAFDLGRRIQKEKILLYLICELTPTLYDLAMGANGLIFQISNNPDPRDLEKIANQVAASIVATIGRGDTVPYLPVLSE